MNKEAVIIGAGIGGIAVAIRLSVMGWKVRVIEKNNYPGGKLTVIFDDSYRFDAGPSLFTLPHLVSELFDIAGKQNDMFAYHKMDISCKYFFADKTVFTAYVDKDRFNEEVTRIFGDKATLQVRKYLDKMKSWYDLTAPLFLEKSLHKIAGLFTRQTLKGLIASISLPLLSSMDRYNDRSFDDKRLVQLFNRYATYNGSNPYVAPGLMCMISHLEHNLGTFLPEKGMHQITEGLVTLAGELGVEFCFNSEVQKIVIEQEKAVGILYKEGDDDKLLTADLIVSDMDIFPTYQKLLSGLKPPGNLIKQEPSSSALIFYWGISRTFEQLDLHNIFFSSDYKNEFEVIFNQSKVSSDPTVYVNITSKYVERDAPIGKENWFVMINVPSDTGQDWDTIISETKRNVIRKLGDQLKVDFESLIETESILDPRSIESRTSSRGGALYGTSSNNPMAAFLRHPNFHRQIEGLYFCGGSVHPGGGIPLCLLSAKIVSELVTNDY